ncbi:hypothetical protein POM88_014053 [Heracleum sosnowskyi]|uniref:Uncharacterized protein n=1 Tax=Heracleum sosnowskyi TaxID=360622 RepID=A0AAD8N3V3_9APIA|nr:hypothetical protein POM88_014053 [Heracleum sosnowskyi]
MGQIYPSTVKVGGRTSKQIQLMVRALSFFCLLSYAEAQEYSTAKIGSQIWLLIAFMVLMAVGGASTSNRGGGSGRGRGRGRVRAGARGRVDGGDGGRGGSMGREDGGDGGRGRDRGRGDGEDGGERGTDNEDVMETENGGVDDEDIASIVQRFQRNASQGDHQKRPINGGPKLGTVHFIDGCIVEPRYKKTLLAIIRTLWDKDTVNTSGMRREAFLDSCAIDFRVFKYL